MCCKPFPVLRGHMLWHRLMHRVVLVHGTYQVRGFHSSYSSRTNTDPVEAAFAGLLLCRIYINRIWLAGGKAIILIGFPFYTCIVGENPWPWMPINTQTKVCTPSMRSAWVAPSPGQTPFRKGFRADTFIAFALQEWYHVRASEIVHA